MYLRPVVKISVESSIILIEKWCPNLKPLESTYLSVPRSPKVALSAPKLVVSVLVTPNDVVMMFDGVSVPKSFLLSFGLSNLALLNYFLVNKLLNTLYIEVPNSRGVILFNSRLYHMSILKQN